MNRFAQKIAATLCAAAIIGNAAFMLRVNDRLARIETKLELSGQNQLAKK